MKYKPFLVKPNNFELGELFDTVLKTDEEIAECARKLQDMGARNVLVSLGGDGALLLGEDGRVYRMQSPKGKLVNSVGAGDSMVGGDLQEALKMGISAGSASAFHDWLATEDDIKEVYGQLP
jgi:1-phosphofructokinase